jgi:hypothetical protein
MLAMPVCSPVALAFRELRLLRFAFCDLFALALLLLFWLEFCSWLLIPALLATAQNPQARTRASAQTCADLINCWLLITYPSLM